MTETPRPVRIAVLTVSDTRTLVSDTGGGTIVARLSEAGHEVVDRVILPDEPDQIEAKVAAYVANAEVDVVLLTGGTGVSSRDRTFEAIERLITHKLPGFGELFRMLSYGQIGPHSMISRATAGVRNRVAIFAMPGAPAAVELALDKLIVPTLGHIVWLLTR